MKTSKMRGFMCQPHASTAVCVPGDTRSVVVPRRPDRTLVDHARVVDLKYTRLLDSPRSTASPTAARSREKAVQTVTMPVIGCERRFEMVTAPTMAKTTPAPTVAVVKRERSMEVPSLPYNNDNVFQVVVMKVSIHCQGCAGKVKKHISKMEGVTSFSIDMESKRVTVMGHVSPTGVLESISKVKKAEFWPSTPL